MTAPPPTQAERRHRGAGAPLAGFTTAPTVAPDTHTDHDAAARCRICRRPLTAPESCRRELGPTCAAHLAASITRATGYRAAVAVVDGALVARLDEGGAA